MASHLQKWRQKRHRWVLMRNTATTTLTTKTKTSGRQQLLRSQLRRRSYGSLKATISIILVWKAYYFVWILLGQLQFSCGDHDLTGISLNLHASKCGPRRTARSRRGPLEPRVTLHKGGYRNSRKLQQTCLERALPRGSTAPALRALLSHVHSQWKTKKFDTIATAAGGACAHGY